MLLHICKHLLDPERDEICVILATEHPQLLYPAPEQQNDGKFKLISKEDLPSENEWERPSSMLDELRTRIVYKHQDGSVIGSGFAACVF